MVYGNQFYSMKQNEIWTLETVNFRRDIYGRGFRAFDDAKLCAQKKLNIKIKKKNSV